MIRTLTGRHRWLVPLLFAVSLAATLLLGGGVLGGASAGAAGDGADPHTGNHIHSADLDGAGRFSAPGEVWPPRPDGAGAPSLVPEATAPGGDSLPAEVQTASADVAVADALGASWSVTAIEVGVEDGKGNVDTSRSEIQFFSLSNNQTVTATLSAGQVTGVAIDAPGDFQPPLAQTEVEQAAAIARQHWVDQGAADINDLQGYGIRAFDGENDFYDVRMVYISFHVSSDELPMYMSKVDLTNGTVLDAQVGS